ncbi:MAG: c-type cytochrome biogenesis protein CcsB [Planctomycetes bacterium]|nr:c-type cytochrome biogenesis protein CcsB [Planctomycetota bacterium]
MRSVFFDLSLYACLASVVAHLIGTSAARRRFGTIAGSIMLGISGLSGLAFIAHEWVELQRPPFVNTFEVLAFLGVALTFVTLAFQGITRIAILGPFASTLALMVLGYATLFQGGVQPVMPALRNNFWLTIHVILCFVAYAGLFLSFIAALLHLGLTGGKHRAGAVLVSSLTLGGILCVALALLATRAKWAGPETEGRLTTITLGAIPAAALALAWPIQALLAKLSSSADPAVLDRGVYRSITFGFPLLGLGIITGAVWANEAWGRYWGWDPKETWSLITWLVYFLYLHFRFMRGWIGPRSSWFAVAGFFAVVFTFFGVSYLLPGLHSYLAS